MQQNMTKEKGDNKDFSRINVSDVPVMAFKMRARERTVYVIGGFLTLHRHLQTFIYSLWCMMLLFLEPFF
jgi:hypothetical protein